MFNFSAAGATGKAVAVSTTTNLPRRQTTWATSRSRDHFQQYGDMAFHVPFFTTLRLEFEYALRPLARRNGSVCPPPTVRDHRWFPSPAARRPLANQAASV